MCTAFLWYNSLIWNWKSVWYAQSPLQSDPVLTFIFIYVCVCVCVCASICVWGCVRVQKRLSHLQELGFHTVVNYLVWVLGGDTKAHYSSLVWSHCKDVAWLRFPLDAMALFHLLPYRGMSSTHEFSMAAVVGAGNERLMNNSPYRTLLAGGCLFVPGCPD